MKQHSMQVQEPGETTTFQFENCVMYDKETGNRKWMKYINIRTTRHS